MEEKNDDEEPEPEATEDPWLPLPGAMPPESPNQSRQVKFLTPDSIGFVSPSSSASTPRRQRPRRPSRSYLDELPEVDEDDERNSPDLSYSLRGDENEDRKYYIYKVRDVNMVPKKECVGKVVIPAGASTITTANGKVRKLANPGNVTLEELRQMIRNSEDEALQEAAKNRFRYLSESYHLVAMDESYTPVDQIYPTRGVFIKLDNEHPFSKPRIDTSLTARLQAEYERRFGPIAPRRPRNRSNNIATQQKGPTKWDVLSGSAAAAEKRSIYNDPLPFNSQAIREQFEQQQKRGSRLRRKRSLSNFRYDSFDYVDGQWRDCSRGRGPERDGAVEREQYRRRFTGKGQARKYFAFSAKAHFHIYFTFQGPPWRF